MTDHGYAVAINPGQAWALRPHPLERIAQVPDDELELGFGREPVINRNDIEPGIEVFLQLQWLEIRAIS